MGDGDLAVVEVQRELEALRKVNRALMKRVERDMDLQKGSFSLFQAAASLEQQVRERTCALETAMTELERSNAELHVAKEAADAASRAKSEFLATMSHEIRTPMNGVLGMTELLDTSALSAGQRQQVCAIRRSAQALLAIINDILDFSKVEAGKLQLEHIEFDLRDLVEDTAEFLAFQAHAKGLELHCHVPASMGTRVKGDPGRLRQVLVNLVGNAIKFTERGSVSVVVHETHRTDSAVSIRIDVVDSGIGVAPDVVPTLFQSFTQADGSMARRYGGSGLGLAIVRHLSALMGGAAGLERETGPGSTFWCSATLERGASVESASPPLLAGMRILVLDDGLVSRRSAADILAVAGATVFEAATEQQARDALGSCAQAGARLDACLVASSGGPGLAGAIHRELLASGSLDGVPSLRLAPPREGAIAGAFAVDVPTPVRQSQLLAAMDAVLSQVTDEKDAVSTPARPSLRFQAKATQGLRVLVVEDNEINREVVVGMLEVLGCSAWVARDGREACAAFPVRPYDVVLMDCQMPEMDGFEATREIRSIEARRGSRPVPVVALTANALQGDRERCIEAGMDEFLSKPFLLAQLRDVLFRSVPAARVAAAVEGSRGDDGAVASDVLDVNALAQIRSLQRPGHPDLLERLITMFLSSSREDMANLRRAAAEGDDATVTRIAHRLKSSSANLGARRLSASLVDLEHHARGLRADSPVLHRALLEHERVLAALAREMRRGDESRGNHGRAV